MTAQTEKKDYEIAVDDFVAAEKKYKELEDLLLSGDAVLDIMRRSNGDAAFVQREWQQFIDLLKIRLEEMNAAYSNAKTLLRQTVVLAPFQWRGPNGTASKMSYGPFTVESKTKRSFIPKELIKGVTRHGRLPDLLALTGFDKDGQEYRLVEQTWKIDYQNVLKWLQSQNLQGVINGAYEEEESTPSVSGAKPLAFIGEKIDR